MGTTMERTVLPFLLQRNETIHFNPINKRQIFFFIPFRRICGIMRNGYTYMDNSSCGKTTRCCFVLYQRHSSRTLFTDERGYFLVPERCLRSLTTFVPFVVYPAVDHRNAIETENSPPLYCSWRHDFQLILLRQGRISPITLKVDSVHKCCLCIFCIGNSVNRKEMTYLDTFYIHWHVGIVDSKIWRLTVNENFEAIQMTDLNSMSKCRSFDMCQRVSVWKECNLSHSPKSHKIPYLDNDRWYDVSPVRSGTQYIKQGNE